jgi:Zn-dependent peptidase ImmA (M78 family)/transcriptional regulator with XRE-family HTH domain
VAVFNREMLTLARESRDLTQTRFAEEELGISQAEVSKYETGVKVPLPSMELHMAARLRYSPEFFYLNESIRAFGSGCVYHRKRQSATETKLQHLLALINVKRVQVKQLLKAVNVRTVSGFEPLDIDEHKGGGAEVAKKLRAAWHLPPGPVQNLIRAVEDAGGFVIQCDFGTSKVDALSQSLPGSPPVFLINNAIPTDRMRFTLAHEIGHIVMHRFPTENMEREADQFAAEFLMPELQIKPQLTYINLPKLASLKPYWRVSMNSLLYRAAEVGAIDSRQKSYLWMKMGQAGYRKNEPVPIVPEEPNAVAELLALHSGPLAYTPQDIDVLLCEPGAFAELRKPSRVGGMRLVK